MASSTRDRALYILQRLRDEGHEAYLAGGYVRDKLLGKAPKDYDIATSSTPESTQRIFPHTVPVGARFGSLIVVIDGEPFEVTTFRFDGPYIDGRRPVHIRYGTLEEDVVRRDFTINAMMYDPMADRVIDLVNGEADLRRGLIRAIGDPHQRFAEDRLRMVRAVRLSSSLGFTIDPPTLLAIQGHAEAITEVAWERIGVELTRTLTEGGARKGLELLDETGLLPVLLPEIHAMKGVEQTPEHHPEGDVFIHTLTLLERMQDPTETLAYGCLLHDVAKPLCSHKKAGKITFYGHPDQGADMAAAIMQRLKRSRNTADTVAWLVKNHLRYTQAPKMKLSTLKRFLAEPHIDELLELCRLDTLSSTGDLTYYDFCKRSLLELGQDKIRPEPLLMGRDLIELGYNPGPQFSEILKRLEEAQLEGVLHTREDAVSWVHEHFKIEKAQGPRDSGTQRPKD